MDIFGLNSYGENNVYISYRSGIEEYKRVSLNKGKFGLYLSYNKTNISIKSTVSLERAIQLIELEKKGKFEIKESPEKGLEFLRKITQKGAEVLEKNKIAKKVYSLLFLKEMSVTDLAIEIYKNKNNRQEITNWIKLFLKKGWIEQINRNEITTKKKYRANLNPFLKSFKQSS